MIRCNSGVSAWKCIVTFIPFTLLFLSTSLLGQIDRSSKPVVITAGDISCVLGKAPGDLVGFSYDNSAWVQRPIQIDERALLDIATPYNAGVQVGYEILFYTDTSTFTGLDPDPSIDEDDELVFMYRDTGEDAGGAADPAGVIPGSRCEVILYDSLNADTSYFYFFDNNGPLAQDAGQNYVEYSFNLLSGDYKQSYNLNNGPNPEKTTYETPYYRGHFSDRWIHDELYVFDSTAYSEDLLDRHKNFFSPGNCGRTEETFSRGRGCMINNIDGPIRAIRSYFGANSGPLSQRTHIFYEQFQEVRTDLRVHYIASIYDLFDYSESVLGSDYFNSDGDRYMVDGVPDNAPVQAFNQWEVLNIPDVGHLHHSNRLEGSFEEGPDGTLGKYWEDNSTNPQDTCTGDDFSIAASGQYIEFEEFICTEVASSSCSPDEFRTLALLKTLTAGSQALDEMDAARLDSSNSVPIVIINGCINSFASITEQSCNEYTSPGGKVIMDSGIYLDTIPNAGGCDSIITIDLTILQDTTNKISVSQCEAFTSPSGKYIWDQSGTYLDTLAAANGCDSIITIDLTILPEVRTSLNVSQCEPYTSPSGKYIWDQSGTYFDTVPAPSGCDTLFTINLTILPDIQTTLNVSQCDPYTSPSGKYIWDQSGTYLDTIPAPSGCDTFFTINLTILPDIQTTLNVSQCDAYTSPSGKYIWDQSGTYLDTVPAASGCDTLFTINLTILPDIRRNLSVSQCGPYTSPSGKYIWDQSGIYLDTIAAASGCDTLFTVNLTILPDIRTTLNVSQCEPYTSPSGKYIWDQSGTYLDTVPAASGCDTLLTINLTILPDIRRNLSVSQCEPYTSPSGKYTWDQSGTYLDTIPDLSGCDSLFTIDLIILPTRRSNIAVSECDQYISPSGRYVWSQSGMYLDTLVATNGCDSILTIDLTILQEKRSNISVSQCGAYTSPSGRYIWDQSGNYLDTINASNGCDSIILINLEVFNNSRSNLTLSRCESYTSPSGNYTWDQSGMYMDTIENAVGCDSFINIDLTIFETGFRDLFIAQCLPYTSPSGKYIWDQSGIYFDTIPTNNGCDSVLEISLQIIDFDIALSFDGDSLLAEEYPGAVYSWIDCSDFTQLSTGFDPWYVPGISGDYAVHVEFLDCSDTSSCIRVNISSSEEIPKNPIVLYPNPSSNRICMLNDSAQTPEYRVLNKWGRVVLKGSSKCLDVSNLTSGVYQMVFEDNLGTLRFVKID